jgi:phosphate transport system substrate-binding protein
LSRNKLPCGISCRNSAHCIELTWAGGIRLKRFIPLGIIILFIIILGGIHSLQAPLRRDETHAPASITLAGSTSVQPFAELLADEYMNDVGSVIINVQGGGSSAGARSALSGVAEVGMLSRKLQGDEKTLIPTIIAYDAIALVVHPSNPSGNLDIAKIQAIFAGKITDWSVLGGEARKIHAVTREEGSGTRGAFDEIIMGYVEVTPAAIVQDSNGSVREIVAGDPSAIGYLSLGLVDKRVKAIAVSGVLPSIDTVANGTYNLVRPMILATRENPRKEVRDFIDFCLSEKAQAMLAQEGLVPVTPVAREEQPGPGHDDSRPGHGN